MYFCTHTPLYYIQEQKNHHSRAKKTITGKSDFKKVWDGLERLYISRHFKQILALNIKLTRYCNILVLTVWLSPESAANWLERHCPRLTREA
jgi:hypothetical protein